MTAIQQQITGEPPQTMPKPFLTKNTTNPPTMTKALFQSLLTGEKTTIFLGKGEARGIAAVQPQKLLGHFSPFLHRQLSQGKPSITFYVEHTPHNKAVLLAVLSWMVNGGDTGLYGSNKVPSSDLAPLPGILNLAKHLQMQGLVNQISDQIVEGFPVLSCVELLKILCMADKVGVKALAFRTESAIAKRFKVMGVNTLLDMYSTCESLGLESAKNSIVRLIDSRPIGSFIAVEHVIKAYQVSKLKDPLRIAIAKGVANRMADCWYKDPTVFLAYARNNEDFFHDSEPFFDEFERKGIHVVFQSIPHTRKPRGKHWGKPVGEQFLSLNKTQRISRGETEKKSRRVKTTNHRIQPPRKDMPTLTNLPSGQGDGLIRV